MYIKCGLLFLNKNYIINRVKCGGEYQKYYAQTCRVFSKKKK